PEALQSASGGHLRGTWHRAHLAIGVVASAASRSVVPRLVREMENRINLHQPLALFVPESAGDSHALLMRTLQAVGQTFPLLSHLLGVVGRTKLSPVPIEQLFTDGEGKAAAEVLKSLFAKYGSDKSTGHNYHLLYGEILKDKDD